MLDRAVAGQKGRVHFQETRAAVNRATLRRVKGNRCRLAASSAIYRDLDPLLDAGELCRGNGRYPLILCIFAFLATLGRVLQLFVAVKNLFTGGPNKMCAAVDAQY